jgi:uncharacterized protein (DUF1697 family)
MAVQAPMATYISLLRGINVGGKNKLSIEELKRVYSSLGFTGVRTYIQSGNIVFESPDAREKGHEKSIEGKIKKAFAMDIPVMVRTREELQRTIESNPFLPSKAHQVDKLLVTFLSDLPDKKAMDKLASLKWIGEDFRIIGREVYLFCPNGYGRTKLTNNAFESKLGVRATTRNWATVNRLLEMARE